MLRARLDPWLAEKCEEAGVTVMPGVRVDRVLTEDAPATGANGAGKDAGNHAGGRRVVGVQAGDDELRSRVVVAADGVNSFIAQDVGLRQKQPLNHLAVGVKSVVSLPRETIEARFNLTGDEGAALAVVGDCTEGVGGGGFLYTNTDSLSVGVVVRLDDLTAQGKVVTDVFDHFLEHRFIAPYLEGGELAEYGCHLVAEGGMKMVGEIAMDGMVVVGDAAGLTLNTGLTVRGMDLAVASAVAAAEGIGAALEKKDTSKAGPGRLPGKVLRLLRRPGHEDLREGPRLPRTRAHVQAVRRAVRRRAVRRLQPRHPAPPASAERRPAGAGAFPPEDEATGQRRHRRRARAMKPLSVPERLAKNRFNLDEEEGHIEVNQEIAKATGTGRAIVACCPAHVYAEEPDGTISVEYAACLECGTCLAVAAPGALKWHYPRGGFGVQFREG